MSTSNPPHVVPTIPVLPESAPFSVTQRAWLNGFLAGLLNTGVASMSTSTTTATPAPTPAEDFPWHDASLSLDERLKLAEGRKPERVLMAVMAQLDCGSCGYVCQSYAEAIASGTDKDLTKCSPGGSATVKKLKELVPLLVNGKTASAGSAGACPTESDVSASTDTQAKPVTREFPASARLLRNIRLNAPGSAKDVRHVEIDLRGTGVSYKPGDALGIWPENDAALVESILEHLNATGAEDVGALDGTHTSFYDALRRQRVITAPNESLIELLISTATDANESAKLQSMLTDEGGQAFSGLHVLDLLHLAPSSRPTPQQFVDALSRLQPRLYSISSSPVAHEGQVHLTVGAVRYRNGAGRDVNGVASTFLADRVRPGERLRVFVHESKSFGLPADPSKPVIMVGPGTGIAPFRAFLHHRKATSSSGRNWLFFGDQRSSTDHLYRDELESLHQAGTLTRQSLAFSRDQQAKVYVQDRMREHAADLWTWLDDGAHFYVCGDASRMAKDVDAALVEVVRTGSGRSADEARAYVKSMSSEGRYQRDVY
ncbi:MAG: sulfite reductase subunit alpha [Tepidisphaeraceae bacterium]